MDLSTWGHKSGSPVNEFETVKEYTKEELFDMYCLENEVPDVIMNYIEELELTIKKLRQNGK